MMMLGRLACLTLAAMPLWASAQQCSRALQVPVAPIGLAVTSNGKAISGFYPDVLRSTVGKGGCKLEFTVVPRARQEMLYETGQADLLVPARRSPRRDENGVFVAVFKSRPMLVSLGSKRIAVRSLAELVQRKDLHVVAVRGYDYGAQYQAALQELTTQGRLQQAVDPMSLARMLKEGMADVAIVLPNILSGALQEDALLRPLLKRLHSEPLEELGWGESGLYVSSKSSLSEPDRRYLFELLARMARSGATWRELQRYYHFDAKLSESVRPIGP